LEKDIMKGPINVSKAERIGAVVGKAVGTAVGVAIVKTVAASKVVAKTVTRIVTSDEAAATGKVVLVPVAGGVGGMVVYKVIGGVGFATGGTAYGITLAPMILIGATVVLTGYGVYWIGTQIGS